ncbi:hypothetical protein [Roseobacter sp. CCS2]|uniref:hypothetical protein n=1 Tax=Roseobacter sp. CCS2 TaxID=391593 RepID=UPI0000F3FDCC|nr:hypothetical protein [Roseobacter sp. CCS2]EBA10640.1 hypothetical protein RCCS2_02570 [Roseobacter sp. CCS2]
MKRAYLFLPLAALVAFAGYLGLQWGQVPSETDIINRYAAAYMETAPSGASPTDCAASPHPDPDVRMVINCGHPFGLTTTYFVGPRGEALPAPAGPEA